MSKEARRHRRLPYSGPVRLSWEDEVRGPRFALVKCIDVSEGGLRIESPVPVPLRATVSLSAGRIYVSGAGSVKHVQRFGAKYLIGVQLNGPLDKKALDTIREPWALRSPVSV